MVEIDGLNKISSQHAKSAVDESIRLLSVSRKGGIKDSDTLLSIRDFLKGFQIENIDLEKFRIALLEEVQEGKIAREDGILLTKSLIVAKNERLNPDDVDQLAKVFFGDFLTSSGSETRQLMNGRRLDSDHKDNTKK